VIEHIKHAAVKSETGFFILLGKCHADCFWQGRNIGLKMSKKSEDQGFMTSKGRYVSRMVAARIAKKAGQLKKDDKRKVKYLLSEDIWYQTERFVYTQQLGYVEIINRPIK
jgi:hypothetical protein